MFIALSESGTLNFVERYNLLYLNGEDKIPSYPLSVCTKQILFSKRVDVDLNASIFIDIQC